MQVLKVFKALCSVCCVLNIQCYFCDNNPIINLSRWSAAIVTIHSDFDFYSKYQTNTMFAPNIGMWRRRKK